MLEELSQIWIRPTLWVGMSLWALGLYWAFSPLHERLSEQGQRWIRFDTEGGISSLLAVLPFLLAAALVVVAMRLTLGGSWAVSLGLIVCLSGGIYELGRRDSGS